MDKSDRHFSKIEILDTTLREGEQSKGVSFTLEQKIDLAKELDNFGVDYIELGHPYSCQQIQEAVTTIASMKLKAKTVGHARARLEDIDCVAKCGTPWIGIFAGINDYCLEYKYHCSRDEMEGKILGSIKHAKSLGLKVRFSCEDAARTFDIDLVELYKKVEQAGADRISIADTVGILVPQKAYILVNFINRSISLPIHVHFHNDFGLAVGNALSALEAGAQVVDVSIDGIGERTGITSLAELCASLKILYTVPNSWKLEKLPLLSEKLRRYTGLDIRNKKPIVGADAFTHKCGLHSAAVFQEPKCYEPASPDTFSQQRTILINKLSGRQAIEQELQFLGIQSDSNTIDTILAILKSSPDLEIITPQEFYLKFKHLIQKPEPALIK